MLRAASVSSCPLRLSRALLRCAAAAVLLAGGAVHSAPPGEDPLDFFEQRIRPVLAQNCYECHSAGSKEVKGGLRLDTREGLLAGGDSGPAVVPGKPEGSLLVEAVRYGEDSYQMPPKGKLPEQVIRDLAHWVELGMPDPRTAAAVAATPKQEAKFDVEAGRRFWAFQKPKKVAPPVTVGDWARTDIDRFIAAGHQTRGVKPVAEANRRTLLRRATFDLTGLPPTEQQLADFAADTRPEAFANVVDRLLATPEFGERWARYWLDLVRYADSNGFGMNFTFDTAWRYRDYVIDSFNADKPYDRFVREQIAGDLLPAANDAERTTNLVATAYLMLGPKEMAQYDKPKLKMDVVNEQVDTTGRALLGLTVGCARCHDHKFDPIPTADYYAMAGIFDSTTTLQGSWGDNMLYSGWLMRPLPVPVSDAQRKALADFKERLDASRKRLRAAQKELAELEKLQEAAGSPAAATAAERAAAAEREKLIAAIKALRDERLAAFEGTKQDAPEPLPEVMAPADAPQPADSHVHIRGQVDVLGPKVPRGFLQVASYTKPAPIDAKHSGRLELAAWLTDRENPLFARVMVNRIWSHLFDEGLVRTVDNFGARGEAPTHPELLDYLAVRFVEQGWSVKAMIREMMLSRVYQLSSTRDPTCVAADPENRMLWRYNRHRADADAIRDSMLYIAGQLDPKRGGPTLQYTGLLFSPENFSELKRNANPWRRRSIYVPILRDGQAAQADLLEIFDFANPNMVTGKRAVTNVPTQGLYLLNSPWVMERAGAVAAGLLAESTLDDAARVRRLFLRTYGREPSSEEVQRTGNFVAEFTRLIAEERPAEAKRAPLAAWTNLCQAVLTSNEFLFVN